MLLKGRESEGKVSIGSINLFIRNQTILQQKQQQQNKASILKEKLGNKKFFEASKNFNIFLGIN